VSMGKRVSEEELGTSTPDYSLENKTDLECADSMLSQVMKGKGAFLGLHQIWCPVPNSWDEAVALSRNTLKRAAH
jgi:hypothetical protein